MTSHTFTHIWFFAGKTPVVCVRTATNRNGDTAQYSNSHLGLLVIGLWRSVFFFKITTEHTAPDPTEMSSFGVLVNCCSAEHFESSSKGVGSASSPG